MYYINATIIELFQAINLAHSINLRKIEILQALLSEVTKKVDAVQNLLIGKLFVYPIPPAEAKRIFLLVSDQLKKTESGFTLANNIAHFY